jgi:hypothetical protein
MIIAPVAVKPQATTLFNPYGASDAGNRKMPEPIMLPTTNAAHIQKPSLRPFEPVIHLSPRNWSSWLTILPFALSVAWAASEVEAPRQWPFDFGASRRSLS